MAWQSRLPMSTMSLPSRLLLELVPPHLPAGPCHTSSPPPPPRDLQTPSNGSLPFCSTTTMMHTGLQAIHALQPTRINQPSREMLFHHPDAGHRLSITQTGRFWVASRKPKECEPLPPMILSHTWNYVSASLPNAVEASLATANGSS